MSGKEKSYEGFPALVLSPPHTKRSSQSREGNEEGFNVISAGGTGWIMDIRNYDCPMGETTTFHLRIMRNKKGHGRTMA
jgi:hypothetical protein